MSQVVSESFYTSAATSLQQTLGFDDWIAVVLMVTNDNGEVTNTESIQSLHLHHELPANSCSFLKISQTEISVPYIYTRL